MRAPGRLSRRLRLFAWTVAFCFLLSTFCFAFRAPLLTGLAKTWVVDDPLTKADAIVVLGGHADLRAPEAARLYQAGIAPLILYMDVKLSPSAQIGIVPSEREQTRRLLLTNSVPETAMMAIGDGVTNTYEESQAVRAWLEKSHASSIIIATDLAHTRRVRWLFRKQLKGSGAQIHVHAVQPVEYSVANWWKHEEGLIAFQNELIKYLYYRGRH
jgi:uncharacterized SAM-binding protein YcdF (DUF218 family)